MNTLFAKLPPTAQKPIRQMWQWVRSLPYRGHGRHCPVCGRASRRFRPAGLTPRPDAQCVHCGSLERHRLLWLYLTQHTDLFDGQPKQLLHVAPEACLEPRLHQQLGQGYLTADLFDPHVMVKMDITNIQYPDHTFDAIYCSHVLEHVPDDHRAMREFYRILKPNGWAILLVPIVLEKTYEDPTITTPSGRLQAFGQTDHVRSYGRDYPDRLREAGFNVHISTPADLATAADIQRMGLSPASGEIYVCTK